MPLRRFTGVSQSRFTMLPCFGFCQRRPSNLLLVRSANQTHGLNAPCGRKEALAAPTLAERPDTGTQRRSCGL